MSTLSKSPFATGTGYDAACAAGLFPTPDADWVESPATYLHSSAQGWACKMRWTGLTSIAIHVYTADHTTVKCSIDGVDTAITGLLDTDKATPGVVTVPTTGTHEIIFYGSQRDYLDLDAPFVGTGTSPSFAQSVDVNAQRAHLKWGSIPSWASLEGGWTDGSAFVAPAVTIGDSDGSVALKAASTGTTDIWIFAYGITNARYQVEVNGTVAASTALTVTNAWSLQRIAASVSVTAGDIIVVRETHATAYLCEIMSVGVNFDTGYSSSRPQYAAIGDSNTRCDVALDSGIGYASKIARSLGVGMYNKGVDGDTIAGVKARTADVTGISPVPPDVVLMIGTNDMVSAGNGSSPSGTNKTDWTAVLNQILNASGFGSTIIHVLGVPPRVTFTSATINNWNSASGNGLQAAIAACDHPDRVVFHDTNAIGLQPGGINDTTNFLASDQTHFNSAGHDLFVTALAPDFVTGYTLTAAAGAFTLTGVAAGLKATRVLTAAAGTFTETGRAANLLYGRKVAAGTGAFVLTGNDARIGPLTPITLSAANVPAEGDVVYLDFSSVGGAPLVDDTYTGITLKVNGSARAILSLVKSGSHELAATPAGLIYKPATDTVTVTIASTNLTDADGNPVSDTTNHAVTNDSTRELSTAKASTTTLAIQIGLGGE
jgi:lysophospholipase L1-like esterase